MKVLRITFYASGGPNTIVLTEPNLNRPIEVAAMDMFELHSRVGGDVDIEVFEMEGTDDERAYLEAGKRGQNKMSVTRRDMEMLRLYLVASLYKATKDGACVIGTPAPLAAEIVKEIALFVMRHKEYRNQSIIVPLSDGSVVQAKNSEVLVRDKA